MASAFQRIMDAQPLLHRQVAREHRLVLHRDRVHVGGVELRLPANLLGARQVHQLGQDEASALGPLGGHQGDKGVAPFGGFLGVDVSHGVLRAEEMGGQWGVHGNTVERFSKNRMLKRAGFASFKSTICRIKMDMTSI